MSHSRIFSYNFERYSAKDLVEFVEELGYKTRYQKGIAGVQERGFIIKETGIIIRFPDINYIKKLNFSPAVKLFGDVKFETYSDIYYPRKQEYIKTHHNFGSRDDQLFKKHEKLYNSLKRKFQMKKDEIPKAIKDEEWLKKLS